MRPAEVCVWKRNPFSSRSLIVLRIVAGESPRPKRLAIVRLAAGSAVCTYVSITAPSTARSRSVSNVVKCSNPFRQNKLRSRKVPGQGGDETVEAQPGGRGAAEAGAVGEQPSLLDEAGQWRERAGEGGRRHSFDRAQSEIDAFELALFVRELLTRIHRRVARGNRTPVRFPRRVVPAPRATLERMRRRARAQIGTAGPVGAVVARAPSPTGGIRDLVELEPGRTEPLVGAQVFVGVAVVARHLDGAARDPAIERRARLHRKTIEREMRRGERHRLVEITVPIAFQ